MTCNVMDAYVAKKDIASLIETIKDIAHSIIDHKNKDPNLPVLPMALMITYTRVLLAIYTLCLKSSDRGECLNRILEKYVRCHTEIVTRSIMELSMNVDPRDPESMKNASSKVLTYWIPINND